MTIELGVVSVETAERDVQQLDTSPGDDELGSQLQSRAAGSLTSTPAAPCRCSRPSLIARGRRAKGGHRLCGCRDRGVEKRSVDSRVPYRARRRRPRPRCRCEPERLLVLDHVIVACRSRSAPHVSAPHAHPSADDRSSHTRLPAFAPASRRLPAVDLPFPRSGSIRNVKRSASDTRRPGQSRLGPCPTGL